MYNSPTEHCIYHSSFPSFVQRPTLEYATRHVDVIQLRGIEIAYFHLDQKQIKIEPAITFLWLLNLETNLYEIKGTKVYEDILAYGEKLDNAIDVLRREILPLLWENYIQEDGVRLSKRAQNIKNDLLARVKI